MPNQSEIEVKTARIVEVLSQNSLDGVLLNGQHNFAWITGGGSNGVDLSRDNGVASILITKTGKRYLVTNNIEKERLLAEEADKDLFEAAEFSWQNEKSGKVTALTLARELAGERIATDIPMFAEAAAIEAKIAPCRYSLTEAEIERARVLGRDSGRAMIEAICSICSGDTERTIAELLRSELAKSGITSVVTLVAADDRIAAFRHPLPTNKTFKETALLVTCAKRGGLILSLSRIVCHGDVPDDLRRRTEAAAFVNAALLDATREGATGKSLYEVAANAYEHVGYADEINLHHQGGAAGYRTREWVIHPESREVVQKDQLFAWNPSITGTKVEETALATDKGIETLTSSPDIPMIETEINGTKYTSPGILSLREAAINA